MPEDKIRVRDFSNNRYRLFVPTPLFVIHAVDPPGAFPLLTGFRMLPETGRVSFGSLEAADQRIDIDIVFTRIVMVSRSVIGYLPLRS